MLNGVAVGVPYSRTSAVSCAERVALSKTSFGCGRGVTMKGVTVAVRVTVAVGGSVARVGAGVRVGTGVRVGLGVDVGRTVRVVVVDAVVVATTTAETFGGVLSPGAAAAAPG
jgi:hypothetical protein